MEQELLEHRLPEASSRRRGDQRKIAPLAPCAIACALGVTLDLLIDQGASTRGWLGLAIGVMVVKLLLGSRAGRRIPWLIAWLGVAAAWHHHRWTDLTEVGINVLAPELEREPTTSLPVTVRGVVVETPLFHPTWFNSESGLSLANLDVSELKPGDLRGGCVRLVIHGPRTSLRGGDALELDGRLKAMATALNPGEADPRRRARARGARLELDVASANAIRPLPTGTLGDRPWTRAIEAIREQSLLQLTTHVDPSSAALASALLLGRREGVEADLTDAFAQTGTTHLLAISGLHLQALAGLIFLLARCLGLGLRSSLVTVAVGSLSYALLVGLAPSVTRSVVMTLAFCLAGLVSRAPRPANSLALAAIVTLAVDPTYLFDAGCQLSFVAVAAIFSGYAPLLAWLQEIRDGRLTPLDRLRIQYEPWHRRTARFLVFWVGRALLLSTVVWMATTPLTAWWFHQASPIAILLNVPLVPLSSVALLASGATLATSMLAPPFTAAPAWLCGLALGWLEAIVRGAHHLSVGRLFTPSPPLQGLVAVYLAVGLMMLVRASTARRLAPVVALVTLGVGLATFRPPRVDRLEIEVMAVGHGLSVLIQDVDGTAFLYDCGRMGSPNVGRRIIAPALWERRIRHLDAVFLSHPDADHYNGLPDLLERFSIGEIRVSAEFSRPSDNPGAIAVLEQARARGIPIKVVHAGDQWPLAGSGRLRVLAPEVDQSPPSATLSSTTSQGNPETRRKILQDNDQSIVLAVESEERALLMTGDLEQEGLARLITTHEPRAWDAVLAPHHGGKKSNPLIFYRWCTPRWVLVSQRPPNLGRNPGAIPAGQAEVLRTWQRGAIRLSWRQGDLKLSPWLDSLPIRTGSARPSHSSSADGSAPSRVALASFAFWRGSTAAKLLATILIGTATTWVLIVAAVVVSLSLTIGIVWGVIEWGAWTLIRPRERRPAIADGSPELDDGEPVYIHITDEIELAGSWYPKRASRIAEGSRPGTVIMLHGFAEDRRALLNRARIAQAAGWNALTIDLRGYGESGGRFLTFGALESADVLHWSRRLAEQGRILGPIVLWGRSMGASVAVRAAASNAECATPPEFAGLILEAAYADLTDAVAVWLRLAARCPRWLSAPLAHAMLARAARRTGVALAQPRPIDLAAHARMPTLLIHGVEDRLVPIATARELAAAFPNAVDLIEIPEGRHANLIEVGAAGLADRISRFLTSLVCS